MLLEVLNPVAQLRGATSVRAVSARPASLDGKKVGLLSSGRNNSDVALKRVGENLQRRYPSVATNLYMNKQPWPAGLIEKVARECDVVVIATAD
jgi:hypothetical protein